ncbi:MAG: DMT family transporter [Deltaproteobacteria bacterium]|nr:DMT family transporter [Deltaproteobacteria bacterium]
MTHGNQQRLGVVLTLLAATGFALKTVLAKLAYRHGVDPLTLLTLRLSVAGAAFSSVLFWQAANGRWNLRLGARRWALVAVLGFVGYYGSAYLDFSGLVHVDATLGRMILFLYPTLVVLIELVLTRRWPSSSLLAAQAVCYSGLLLMLWPHLSSPGAGYLKGCLYIFASASLYAAYLTAVDRFFRAANMVMFISLIMTVASLAAFVHFFLARDFWALQVPFAVYLLAGLMAVFSTVLPCYALSVGIALLGASKAASLSMIGPAVTLLFGFLLLDESLTALQAVGLALIVVGVSRVK